MKKTPFCLEEYLENPDRKIVTRWGKEVKIIKTDEKTPGYPVLAKVGQWLYHYTAKGEFFIGSKERNDLFFE